MWNPKPCVLCCGSDALMQQPWTGVVYVHVLHMLLNPRLGPLSLQESGCEPNKTPTRKVLHH